jgi:hypothetical protein
VIDDYAKTKLVDVETQASFLIANENHDEVQGEISLLVESQKMPIKTKGWRRVAHPRDYKDGRASGHGTFR